MHDRPVQLRPRDTRRGSSRASANAPTRRRHRRRDAAWRARDRRRERWSPRSALDVLVDLPTRSSSRRGRRVPAVPLGLTPLDKTHRRRPPRRRAAADRRRAGHRQDDDGAADGAQHRARRPGERALHLLRARRGSTCSTASSRWSRPSPHLPAPRPTGASRSRTSAARSSARWIAQGGDDAPTCARNPRLRAGPRAHQPLRPEPVPAARLADREHRREHARARRAAPASSSGERRLVVFVDYMQKVPAVPGAARPRPRRSPTSSTGSRTSRWPRRSR